MSTTFISSGQLSQLAVALSPVTTTSQTSAPVINNNDTNAVSPNAAENPVTNSPTNTPITVSGNASTAATAIKKANQNLAHACDTSTYVGGAVYQVGAFAGQIIRGVRAAIQAILNALGINPSGSAISSKLKKLAQYVKDITKAISEVTTYLQKFIAYVNAIKQVLALILALPVILLKYFADCISTLGKQLVAGYQSAIGSTEAPTPQQTADLNNAIGDVTNSIQGFTAAVATAAGTATAATLSLTVPTTISSGNTQAQAAATTAVFAAAGFSSTPQPNTKA